MKEYMEIPLWLRNLWTTGGQKDLWWGFEWTPGDLPRCDPENPHETSPESGES